MQFNCSLTAERSPAGNRVVDFDKMWVDPGAPAAARQEAGEAFYAFVKQWLRRHAQGVGDRELRLRRCVRTKAPSRQGSDVQLWAGVPDRAPIPATSPSLSCAHFFAHLRQ